MPSMKGESRPLVINRLGNRAPSVRVRGHNTVPELLLDDTVSYSVLERDLRAYLAGVRGYFSGHAVRVNLGCRLLNEPEIQGLCRILDEEQISIAELCSAVEPLEKRISQSLSAPVVLGTRPRKLAPSKIPASNDTLWVPRTCRTGTAIHYPGNMVVLGNINPGAEVVAGGDVVVVGTLRGLVHAGATGDRGAVIIAFSLQATQIRIAGLILAVPSTPPHGAGIRGPEVAYVREGSIRVEAYTGVLPKEARRSMSAGRDGANW